MPERLVNNQNTIQNYFKEKKMKLTIALEWFLNPDHLPILAGIQTNKYKEAGLEVELIEPMEHYDGFAQLEKGEIDLHINEPLHLFEHYFDGLKSLGCYFETRGGVMMRASSVEKLRNNEAISITTPASNPITNTIGFEILSRYAQKEGFTLDKEKVTFIETDFYHIKNLKEGDYDGAWLCFYNFEGIEAEHEGFENLFIDQFKSPYPNFSALEIMTTDTVVQEKKEALQTFIRVTNEMVGYCQKNTEFAKTIYYDYSKTEPFELMDKIIEDSIPRFEYLKNDAQRWKPLERFLNELDIIDISENQYQSIWLT
ncbi:MAG: Hydroxymethylpyrimidine ABC transporter, substrate-binding component [uncultured Sulfurovum sp.]|uniref:Thiamine pyrimidine synthase n=1 Tax=uncultured Sulfurovum sp. TaxID=269237 RepID=A0A6S6T6R0_9BACT|nr:MAG: Hydroxymethylpyrimidine ABC transporter, substrate-binding component [uncultured Sulfurovum sp.]